MGLMLSLQVAADGTGEAPPDAALLEFIAEWRSDGELLDPASFSDEPEAPRADAREQDDDEAR